MPQGPPTLKVGETLRRKKKADLSSEKSLRRRRRTLRLGREIFFLLLITDKIEHV